MPTEPVSDSDWTIQSQEFIKWCGNAVGEIDDMARTTSANMEKNMVKQINALERRAIEAAAENDN
jgi:uncharacterized protein YifE (UPF0438 family)